MVTQVNEPQVSPNQGAAETVPGAAPVSVQTIVDQLRATGQQFPDIAPLTPKERLIARRQGRMSQEVIEASAQVISASDTVLQGVGQTTDEVRQLVADSSEWDVVERELRAMLKAVADANLVRRQRASIAASRAYLIAQQVARDPNNASLRPHVEEVKRLKALARRKKPAAQVPQPQTQSTEQENPATPDSSKK
jgi:hypothetical protein